MSVTSIKVEMQLCVLVILLHVSSHLFNHELFIGRLAYFSAPPLSQAIYSNRLF